MSQEVYCILAWGNAKSCDGRVTDYLRMLPKPGALLLMLGWPLKTNAPAEPKTCGIPIELDNIAAKLARDIIGSGAVVLIDIQRKNLKWKI
jgi:hypothetical protein